MVKRVLGMLLLGACASFPDPDVVVDLRILGMTAEPPEQVIDVDLDAGVDPAMVLAQLQPTEVCALVAEPDRERALKWSMTLCALDGDERCGEPDEDDPDQTPLPTVLLEEGIAPDYETTPVLGPDDRMCTTIAPSPDLLAVIATALERADFGGVGGIDYGVSLAVVGADEPLAPAIFGGKGIRVSARIPMERTPNLNPTLDGIDASLDGGEPVRLPLGRCIEQTAPLTMAVGSKLRLTPIENAATRDVYVVPTLDGSTRMFTESPTYQWLAGAGGYSAGSTGGTRDGVGNLPPLFTDFTPPQKPEEIGEGVNVPLWMIQRDERLGARIYESCVRVVP